MRRVWVVCVCFACGYDYCYDDTSTAFRQDGGILCQCTTVSRRELKKDITYVDDARRDELARGALPPDVYGRLSVVLAAAQRNQAEIARLRSELGEP